MRRAREEARIQARRFAWDDILAQYESELTALHGGAARAGAAARLRQATAEGRPTGTAG